jgi:hypothetical protein
MFDQKLLEKIVSDPSIFPDSARKDLLKVESFITKAKRYQERVPTQLKGNKFLISIAVLEVAYRFTFKVESFPRSSVLVCFGQDTKKFDVNEYMKIFLCVKSSLGITDSQLGNSENPLQSQGKRTLSPILDALLVRYSFGDCFLDQSDLQAIVKQEIITILENYKIHHIDKLAKTQQAHIIPFHDKVYDVAAFVVLAESLVSDFSCMTSPY